jgi:hypothetical protein
VAVKTAPYDIGDDLQLEATFTNSQDDEIDPTTVTLRVVCPDGVILAFDTGDMTNPSVGVYQVIYTVANGWGVYKVTWHGEGSFAVVEQDSFRVRKPAA